MPFIPHTADDVQQMLKTIGAQNIEDLFDEIPEILRATPLKNIPKGLSEFEAAQLLQALATQNQNGDCFIGAGAYEHFVPAAVWELTSRGEFLTAYTPYQAEASQGTLTLIYEYQTMIASLTGMDAANASLYDGASALAEAVLMAVRANRRSKSRKILVPTNVNPDYCRTIKATVDNQKIELVMVPYCQHSGQFLLESLTPYSDEDITAIIIQQPNFFGQLEAVDELTNWAHQQQALVIASVNPIALALLKEPGQWGEQGADIVCGEGQPLGVPLASGGPYFGFMACKQALVRQMPGRIVGRTVDADGQPGFTLTLQAREQHIRRGKATSNICTNQGLLVTAATIYMSLLGFTGLQHVAAKSHENTQLLLEKLTAISGVELIFKSDRFHEVALRLALPVEQVLTALASKGIQGGYALTADYPELGNALLVCATEIKTPAQLQRYADVLAEIMDSGGRGQKTEDRKGQVGAASSRGLTGFVAF